MEIEHRRINKLLGNYITLPCQIRAQNIEDDNDPPCNIYRAHHGIPLSTYRRYIQPMPHHCILGLRVSSSHEIACIVYGIRHTPYGIRHKRAECVTLEYRSPLSPDNRLSSARLADSLRRWIQVYVYLCSRLSTVGLRERTLFLYLPRYREFWSAVLPSATF